MNKTLLMSDCLNFGNHDKINPYYYDEPINQTKASAEHLVIKRIFETIGCRVTQVPSPAGSQDGVYTANWALVKEGKAILSRLPNARKSEESHAKKVLENLGKQVFEIPEALKFSGQGDALPCGDLLFCGSKYRSDSEAQQFVAETLGFRRIQLQAAPQVDDSGEPVINSISGWPDSFFYDIDLALSIIKQPTDSQKGLIAYCPDAFTPKSQQILANLTKVDKIIVDITEAKAGFACNLVSTGRDVVMSAHAPKLKKTLEEHGLTVHTPEIKELAKGGGYIRCISLALD